MWKLYDDESVNNISHRFEGQEPHPFAAKMLLRTLSTDPGVLAVMKEHEVPKLKRNVDDLCNFSSFLVLYLPRHASAPISFSPPGSLLSLAIF
jgi:hypothetical protein